MNILIKGFVLKAFFFHNNRLTKVVGGGFNMTEGNMKFKNQIYWLKIEIKLL